MVNETGTQDAAAACNKPRTTQLLVKEEYPMQVPWAMQEEQALDKTR